MTTGAPPAAEKQAQPYNANPPGRTPPPTILHILHSWGGGAARWTEDFSRYAPKQRHLILYSLGDRNVFGRALELVDSTCSGAPLAHWKLTPPIRATDITHAEYAAILADLCTGLAVEAVITSSLIGHSLDALTTGLPTLRVLHDLYPYCPAMFGYFDGSCEHCDLERLTRCLRSNPRNECWHNSVAEHWLALRRAYAAALLRPEVRLVAPTRTARNRLYRLYTEISSKTCHIIAHGIDLSRIDRREPRTNINPVAEHPHSPSLRQGIGHSITTAGKHHRKLRIVVPGRLEPHKGLQLLRETLPRLIGQAEFLLLGCGLFGQAFADLDSVTIVPDYNFADLGSLIQDFAPDCALLLSLLPETFSYTLSEMMALGLPPLATNLGAFAERIQHGVDGFLYEPNERALTALVTSLAKDRSPLIAVAQYLRVCPVRQVKDMVRDYQTLLPPTLTAPVLYKARGRLGWGLAEAQAQSQAEYTALKQEAFRQSTELEEIRRQMAKINQTLAHHQAQTAILEQELTALRHSNSWRLTKPLRALTTIFRAWRDRFFHSTSRLPLHPAFPPPTGKEKKREDAPPLPPPALRSPHGRGGPHQKQNRKNGRQRCKLRARLRERLGIPDAAHIVLGVAQENRSETVQAFIQAAATLANRQRDLYFLWLEGKNTPPFPAEQKEMGLALAPRRLFFEKTTPSCLPVYLAASDLLYLPEGDNKIALHSAEITALGIPVIRASTENDLTTTLAMALQDR